MDFPTLLNQAGLIVSGGIGVYFATEVVKLAKSIPWVSAGQTGRIRAVAGVLSALAVLLERYTQGTMVPQDVQGFALSLLALAGTFALAHGTHIAVKSTAT